MAFSPSKDDLARMFARPSSASKRKVWDGYVEAITSKEAAALLEEFEIVTPDRWHGLVGTWSVETGGLTIFWESGAYTAAGIMRVFGVGKHSAAVTEAEARRLAGNGEALFERVYGLGNPKKAKELGNKEPGDGWRFRGMGPPQLTGRWAHEKYAGEIGCTLDELCTPLNGLRAALMEWRDKNCNAYADKQDWVSIRKLINGGSLKVPASRLNGLKEAIAASKKAQKIWPKLLPQIELKAPEVEDELPEPKIGPVADATASDLIGISRKVTLLVRFKKFIAWTGIGSGSAFTLADITDNQEALSYVAQFISQNPLLSVVAILSCIGLVGYVMANVLVRWHLEDVQDGRYIPKGAADGRG